MTRDEAIRVVKLLAKPHNVSVDAALVDVWFNACLARTDFVDGLAIARELASTARFLPKPVEFTAIAKRRDGADRKPLKTLGESEWAPNETLAKQQLSEMRSKLHGRRTTRPGAGDAGGGSGRGEQAPG
jgi:hypothetical protein